MATFEELYRQYAAPDTQDRVQSIKNQWAAMQGGSRSPQNAPSVDTVNNYPQYGGMATPAAPAPTAPNNGQATNEPVTMQQRLEQILTGKYPGAYGSTNGMFGYANPYDHSNYINQMYGSALDAQKAQLQAGYERNLAELAANRAEVDRVYTEQKRQAAGEAEREAANWRELANAYGLNSGAIGQAALAQGNQLQSNLNALASAQAAAIADIERQRALLGKEYQLQISQAIAENKFELANALYQEAVRQDEYLDERLQGLSGMRTSSSSGGRSRTRYSSDSIRQNHQYSTEPDAVVSPAVQETPVGANPVTSNAAPAAALKDRIENSGLTSGQQLDLIERYYVNGLITDDEANTLMDQYEREKAKAKNYGKISAYTK